MANRSSQTGGRPTGHPAHRASGPSGICLICPVASPGLIAAVYTYLTLKEKPVWSHTVPLIKL
jgi:hypothetical protein